MEKSSEEMRKICGSKLGMIFQNTKASLVPVRRIEEQLYEAVQQHQQLSKEVIHKQALEILHAMKLSDGEQILKSYPFELSGGMCQRVGIMMAMIMQPEILFADEPTSALDVTVQAQIVEELMHLREVFGTTIILVTHNIGVVEAMADRVAVMYQGKQIECGTTDEVLHHSKEAYTKRLIAAVPRLNRR